MIFFFMVGIGAVLLLLLFVLYLFDVYDDDLIPEISGLVLLLVVVVIVVWKR